MIQGGILRKEVPLDFYATPPSAVKYLLKNETFDKNVWECACGNGMISKELEKQGYNVRSTDIIYRGYGEKDPVDFLKETSKFNGDIITNPPFSSINEFILKGIELTNNKLAIFGKIQLLESFKRYNTIYKHHPFARVYVFVRRISCMNYGDPKQKHKNSAICYCWYIWDKSYKGEPVIRWIDNEYR